MVHFQHKGLLKNPSAYFTHYVFSFRKWWTAVKSWGGGPVISNHLSQFIHHGFSHAIGLIMISQHWLRCHGGECSIVGQMTMLNKCGFQPFREIKLPNMFPCIIT